MSAVEKNSWPEAQGDEPVTPGTPAEPTKPSAERPTLVAPPPRPVRPTPPKPTATAVVVPPAVAVPRPSEPAEPAFDPEAYRHLPIAPPSEPMQYRAIGLVRGTYTPTEADQLNRGNLVTEEGFIVDSVLLGRVTSLVKKHLDLAVSHLWVVYPRTRREAESADDPDLHFQIVGVWEPETLGLPGESPKGEAQPTDEPADKPTDESAEATPESDAPSAAAVTSDADTKTTQAKDDKATLPLDSEPEPEPAQDPSTEWPTVDDNYFSIRGEVLKHEPEEGLITVKILQGIKRTPGGAKSFKLTLQGQIEGRTVGYFWDFKVKRDAKILAVEAASVVGIVPPKKRPKGSGGRRPGGKRPSGGPRSSAPPPKPSGTHGSPRPKKVGSDQETSE